MGDAEAAEQLHRLVDHRLGAVGGVELGEGGFAAVALPFHVAQPGGAVDEQRGRIDVEHHLGELRLGDRIVGEGALTELAREGAAGRLVERAAGEAEGGGANGRAEHVQRRHRLREAPAALAEQGLGGKLHPVEAKRRQRVRGDHTDAFAGLQAGRVRIDDEGGEALRPRRFAGAGEKDIEVGDAAVLREQRIGAFDKVGQKLICPLADRRNDLFR